MSGVPVPYPVAIIGFLAAMLVGVESWVATRVVANTATVARLESESVMLDKRLDRIELKLDKLLERGK